MPANAQSPVDMLTQARIDMDALQTVNFEGGQLRRSLYGRWIRRDDDGQCSTYRYWGEDGSHLSIWNEEDDSVLTIDVNALSMRAGLLNAGERSLIRFHTLTDASAERDLDPMRDCNDPPDPVSVPVSGGVSGDFPLETIHTRNGIFSRISATQWRYLPGHGDGFASNAVPAYDVVGSSENHLLAFNEANQVYALVELDNRSFLIFSLNGVVDQFYPIITTTPEFAWETASQRRDMTATEMTTIDYEGGQFRRLTSATWVDVSDENGCSYYQEWNRDFGNLTMLARRRGPSPSPSISINVFSMTATVHSGYSYNAPVAETRQLIAIGNEDLGEDPSAICRPG
ncbi:hypothetical protein HFP51_01300 [Parasphingopyxis sp. CP4]|uniref:hypothetical protein n=1 Tax=Parasphingopyxis sp. CP4 TaxID=2724527 RepID=UPI0015A41F73|nr:hypothetical protein [Parasphingopyxis sp. CP4]QLC20940.1 hypothetical protein HFP51_01300 [Parasphingopyxis sp. CP4]